MTDQSGDNEPIIRLNRILSNSSRRKSQDYGDTGENETHDVGSNDIRGSGFVYMLHLVLDLGWRRGRHCE